MKTVMFKGRLLSVQSDKTYANGRLALVLLDANGDVFAHCTVNLPDFDVPEGCCYIKDYSENAGMLDALVVAGVVSEPLKYSRSGFVDMPMCRYLGGE